MPEFFIVANSFAAPFVSDTSTKHIEAETAEAALEAFAAAYSHPAGLYAAICYGNADAYHKSGKPLAKWMSNQAQFMQENANAPCSVFSKAPGSVELNGEPHRIKNPKAGAVVE